MAQEKWINTPLYTYICMCSCTCVHFVLPEVKEALLGRISLNPIAGGPAEPAFSHSLFRSLPSQGPHSVFLSLLYFPLQIRDEFY